MTASPRSGPALLIAACILTVTGTVFAGNSDVHRTPDDRGPQATARIARPGAGGPARARTPRPAVVAVTPTVTPPRPRPRQRDAAYERANRQWLLRLVAPLHQQGGRTTS